MQNGMSLKTDERNDIMKKLFCRAAALLISTAALAGCGQFTEETSQVYLEEASDITTFEAPVSEATTSEATVSEAPISEVTTPETTASETVPATEFIPVEAAYTTGEISGSFDGAFLKETLKKNENFVISPLSAKLALNMAALGAEENTEKELLELFGYADSEALKAESKRLIEELDRDDGTLTVNNSVWVSDKLETLNESYSQELTDVMSAESFNADLTSQGFVNDLNGWVNENTNGLIPQLLSQPLDESARLALVNTLYFNNKWLHEFDSYSTYDADFYGVNGTKQVPTMHLGTTDFDYAEGKKLKSVVLPYKNGSKMKVYLPVSETESIADIIGEMSLEELSAELEASYTQQKVVLTLPKFECDYSGSLKEMLQLLGVSEAFDPDNARFGKISDEQLYISEVIQAAKIKCDEGGTEAAAATIVTVATTCAVEDPIIPIQFIVDRPFLYEIESPSGEPLFMGVIQSFTE